MHFSGFGAALRLSFLAIPVTAALSLPASAAPSFTKLYSFCKQANCTDGSTPHLASPYLLANGDIIGTTERGGDSDTGTIWQLKKNGNSYTYSRIYTFCNDPPTCTAGGYPIGQLIEDTAGNLYGVAGYASRIYKLAPNAQHTAWTYSVVFSFTDLNKGFSPGAGLAYQGQAEGDLWDGKSPVYGSTMVGGTTFQGVVYKLTPHSGSWTEDVLHTFCNESGCTDGGSPTYSRLLVDKTGKTLFGTTNSGGADAGGTVFQLKTTSKGWKYTILHNFCSKEPLCADGKHPNAGVIPDSKGNLYGTTLSTNLDGGIVYKLTTGKKPKLSVLYHYCQTDCKDGDSLYAPLVMDKLGNLTVTSWDGGLGGGTVMLLSKKGKRYNPTVLYTFCQEANCTDGKHLWSTVTRASEGTLFGLANEGGANNAGLVFSIKP